MYEHMKRLREKYEADEQRRSQEFRMEVYLACTGGESSWLDDPLKVRRARLWLKGPATAVIWCGMERTLWGRPLKWFLRGATGASWYQEYQELY